MTIFEKNLEVIADHSPEFAEQLRSSISTDHIKVVYSQQGAARLLVTTESGDEVAIHNADDPLQIAENTASMIFGDEPGVVVLLGMGIGYLAKALAKRLHENASLVIYEVDFGVFKVALQELDLTELFDTPRIKIAIGSYAGLGDLCARLLMETGGGVRAVRFEPSIKLHPTIYQEALEKEIQPMAHNTVLNISTLGKFGAFFTHNVLEAIPYIVGAGGVNVLQNLFEGVPAIIVAAGPSLEKNVRYLKEAKGRAVIISADTVIGYLLARGITPDFVVSVDPQEATYSLKFIGVDIPPDIHLVFHPGCHNSIVKHFPGPQYVMENFFPVYHWLSEYWPEKGNMMGESHCQAHVGFDLANWMGCDPIVIIGQDLCYTDDLMHVKGGSYLTQEKADAYLAMSQSAVNIFGETVKTYNNFLAYKVDFEKKFKTFSRKAINATEGGLPLKGADIRRLVDVMEEWPSTPRVDIQSTLRNLSQGNPDVNWDGLIQDVGDRVKDFHRIHRVSQRLWILLKDIEARRDEFADPGPELIRLSNRAERLTKLIPTYSKALGLLQIVDFQLERYMMRGESEEIDLIVDPVERLEKQTKRGLRYYGALIQWAPIMHQQLDRLRKKLETVRDLQLKSSKLLTADTKVKMAEDYVSLEMFRQVVQVLGSQEKSPMIPVNDVRRIALEIEGLLGIHQLDQAWEKVRQGIQQFPVNSDLQHLYGRVFENWTQWNEKVQAAHDSMIQVPPVSGLEGGDFYFRVKDYQRAEDQYRQATQGTHAQSGEAWYRLAKTLDAQERTDEAVEALEQALLHSPADPRIYYDLGVLSLAQQRIDLAEPFFTKGAEITLDDPEFCEAVGAVFAAAGLPAKAIPFYERALLGSPGNGELLHTINETYQSIFEAVPSA